MNESFRRALRLAPVLALVWSAAAHTAAHAAPGAGPYRFAFGPGKPPAGYTAVDGGATGKPFYFSVDLPEGNYKVTVTLGDDKAPATTTIKSELRRLMLENVPTKAGETVTRSFIVNVKTPQITVVPGVAAGEVKLKVPRESVQEAWNWDRRLTLEFNGARPGSALAPSRTG
jgi:hypothetical protein